MVRAIGPSLAAFGITGVLANPTLYVANSAQAVIASNDDWQSPSDNAAMVAATPFAPTNPLESAMVLTLQPGAYTAVTSGVGGGTGVGTVEVFPLYPN